MMLQLWLPLQHVPMFTDCFANPLCPVKSVAITSMLAVLDSLASGLSFTSLNSVNGTCLMLPANANDAVKSTFSNLKLPWLSAVTDMSAPLHSVFEGANLHLASVSASGIFWISSGKPLTSREVLYAVKGVLPTNR